MITGLVLAALLPSHLSAAAIIWNYNGSDFNAGSSWSGGVAPGPSDFAYFPNTSASPVLSASISIYSFYIDPFSTGSFTLSASGSYTLTLGAIGLYNDSPDASFSTNSAGLNIAFSANSTFFADGAFTVGASTGSINLGTNTLTLDGAATTATLLKGFDNSAGSLVKAGSGTWTLGASSAHTGGTAINSGTLVVAAADALGTSGTISFGGGLLRYSGAASTTDYSSRFSTAASQQFKLDTNGENVTLANTLTSAGGSLAKSGAGTLTLSGSSSSLSGGTSVSAGTLRVSGTGNALGAVTVSSGATLQIAATNALSSSSALTLSGGTLQVSGGAFSQDFGSTPLSLTASSTIDFGSGLGNSALTFGNSSGQSWTGILTILNYNNASSDSLRFGTTSGGLSGSQVSSINFNGVAAQIDANGFVTPVPEPATYALIAGVGAFAVVVIRRRFHGATDAISRV